MKIVINKCFGGFGLSPSAVKELAKLQGKKCYFFSRDWSTNIKKMLTLEEVDKKGFWEAYDTKEIKYTDGFYEKHYLTSRPNGS